MRFLHTSDWHLGRVFYNLSLIEDQAWVLDRLVKLAIDERVDAVLIAGDVYDRAVPPTDAVALLDDVLARIDRVRGQFRQDHARADWLDRAAADPPLVVVRANLTVSSGTFVRALAHHLGDCLGCGGLLLALRRTRIGDYRTCA